jgi:hypothetical protein
MHVTFDDFNAIGNLTNATMPMQWFSDLKGGENAKYLAFFFSGYKYPIYSSCIEGVIAFQHVTKVVFGMAMNKVKEKCEGATQGLILELEMQFLEQEIMTTSGVVYPQYWAVDLITAEKIFFSHLNMLKAASCYPHKIGGLDQDVPPLLSAHMFDL